MEKASTLDIFGVKMSAYQIADLLEQQASHLMGKPCDNNETGEARSEIYSILLDAYEKVKRVGDSIY